MPESLPRPSGPRPYRTLLHDGCGWVLKEDADRVRAERDRYLRMLHELIAIAGRPGDGALFNATMQTRDRLNAEFSDAF